VAAFAGASELPRTTPRTAHSAVDGRRQESDVTELDTTGDPDDTGAHTAPGGVPAATASPGHRASGRPAGRGRTQVIAAVGRTQPGPPQPGPPSAESGPVGPGHGQWTAAGPGRGVGGAGYGGFGPAGPTGYGPAPTPTWAAGHVPPPGAGYPPGAPPPAATGGRRLRTVVVALVAVVVLVAAGVLVYLTLRGGGGDTPAEATRLLADDLQSGDLAGAVTRLHPDEVALGEDLGGMLTDELVRLEILRPNAQPDALLTGLTFAHLQFDDTAVEQVRPGVAITKLVGGTVTVDRDVNALPLTDSYKRLAYPNGVPPAPAPEVIDIATVVADQGRPVRVATVQVDGDWYVSLAYTIADNALVKNGASWPQGSIAPRGAATAQDALRDTVSALLDQDARRLVELAPPHELSVVHDLGPLLVERAGTPRAGGARLVDLATTQSEVDGGTALTVDRLIATDGRGNQFTVVRDGDCLAVTAAGSPGRVCADDLVRQGVATMPHLTDPAVRDVVTRATRAALGLRVVVVEDDGQYYVSPARTLAGLGVDVLKTLQPADVAHLAAAAD
jgi:hypothetical protein